MKVFLINSFPFFSTGKIMQDLYKTIVASGNEAMISYGRMKFNDSNIDSYRIGNELGVRLYGVLARLTDGEGRFSHIATRRLIKQITKYNPDVIHLHNIHGYYLNHKILFDFLKVYGRPVIWTLHDCWAFTGHCAWFSNADCYLWKTQCQNCIQKRSYPASVFFDNSKNNFKRKREMFTNVPNMTLVTVSNWLGNLVKQSFLNEYDVVVVHNGIDLSVFKPTKGNLRKKLGLEDKKIVLAVSTSWSDERKGLKDVLKLADSLNDDYKVIVVGLTEKEKKSIGDRIIGITRTTNMQELAEIYSMADVFFNASVEETFGLPTVEAMACGTPVIVYNATAVPEVVTKECGFVVEKHDIDTVKLLIDKCSDFDRESIIRVAGCYCKQSMAKKYLEIYSNARSKKR